MAGHPLRTPILVVLAACALAAGGARAQEAATEIVTARMEWEPGYPGGSNAKKIEFEPKLPEGVRPPAGVKEARYAQIKVAEIHKLTFVMDVAKGSERIWIDRDLDGDLSEDRYGRWAKTATTWTRSETILVPYEGEEHPVPVEIFVYRTSTSDPDTVNFRSKLHRVGEVVLAGRLRRVAIKDQDNDLRFNCKSDYVLLDVDGDGRFATGAGTHELRKQGEAFRIGDEGWVAHIPGIPGFAVEFTRTKEPPPRTPRTWRKIGVVSSNYRPAPPTDSLADLRKRFEKQKNVVYSKRYPTVNWIGQVGTDASFKLLRNIAEEDADMNMRAAAVRAMGNANYLETHAAEVVKFTKSKTPSIASAAIQSLHRMGYPEREKLFLKLMKASHPSVVGAAAKHLAYLESETAHKAVIKACREIAADTARYQAYQGARALPDGPPLDLMLSIAASAYAPLRAMAITDLLSLDHPRAHALALDAAEVRPVQIALGRAVLDVLGSHADPESVKALMELAQDLPASLLPDLTKRLSTLRSPESVDVLLKFLSAKEPETRTLAAQILAGIPERNVTDALLKRVKREKDVGAAAAQLEALGDHGDPRAVDLLLRGAKKKGELRSVAIRALARLGFGLDKVRAFLLKLLDSKKYEDRILAIDAARASGEMELGPRVLRSLDHDRWEVRLVTVEALRALRSPKWVQPLVDRLQKEDERRVQRAIGVTLFQLTGMNLYDDPNLWRQWWKDQGRTFKMPEEIPTLPKRSEDSTRGGFYGIPVDSDRVTFVIDQSGSMSALDAGGGEERRTRFAAAVIQVNKAVGNLSSRARVNVIFFHSTVHPWKDKLTKLTGKNRRALRKYLDDQRPTGGTNIYDPLEKALTDGEVDTVILLSDGVPGAGRYVTEEDIVRAVRRLNQTRRIAIHCVSLGRDSRLLKRLATENGGSYVRR